MPEQNESIRDIFFQECDEQLTELENGLNAIERSAHDSETINAVFRAVHSIKGGAGAFGLEQLVQFAHSFETTLDRIRDGALVADSKMAKTLLRSADLLVDLVQAARAGVSLGDEKIAYTLAELNALNQQNNASSVDEGPPDDIAFAPVLVDFSDLNGSSTAFDEQNKNVFEITFKPHARLYTNANEPALLLEELYRMGDADVVADISNIPALDGFDPNAAYLGWSIKLRTNASEADIREVFDFVLDDCDLEIRSAPPAPLEDQNVQSVARLLREIEEPFAASKPAIVSAASQNLADIKPAQGNRSATHTIRVETERVDKLVDFIGELVINQAMLAQWISESGLGRGSFISNGLGELERLTREIQDSVMSIRAQPIGPVFQRMGRIVREVGIATGKMASLICEGEATEIDKTVIERIAEPLTHMIRNAVDHGLEMPEARLAAGKAAEGVITLSARHRSGRIVIEVADDGAGINRSRVFDIAVRKGLVAADARLSESEIDNLIFAPGFSTAESVSDISGRGVGMDVVRKSLQALGGRVSIASEPGKGSTFTLSLPLTLAVLDGMVVGVGDQTLVIPLTAIVETLQLTPAVLHALGVNGHVISVRNTLTPLVDVGHALGIRTKSSGPIEGIVILVESDQGGQSALLVDAIHEQRQIVVKSLETNYGRIPGIAAATILGDGRVALILDVDALVVSRQPSRIAVAA